MSKATTATPSTDADLFAPKIVADPFPTLTALRGQARAVYSTKHDFYVLTRYDDVRATARDWESFHLLEGRGTHRAVQQADR